MSTESGSLGESLTTARYKLASFAANITPGPLAQYLCSVAGSGFAYALRESRTIVERHLRRVNPSYTDRELRAAVQESFDSYGRYWMESFRLPHLSKRVVENGFTKVGYEHVLDGLRLGNGVILALPHLGGWEWAGRWMTDQGHRLTVVVEQLENQQLFDWFKKLRSELGMTVVPVGPEAAPAIARALKNNEVVCLLCDRDIQGGGVEVEFFGERTTVPAGPAMLSLRTGATLLPVAVYFEKRYNGHHAIVRPPVPAERGGSGLRDDVQRITQALAVELEYLIRRAPEQWHLFQPNWPSDPGYGT
jgi:KDO2-lipid IV(A) lauroyltransferase